MKYASPTCHDNLTSKIIIRKHGRVLAQGLEACRRGKVKGKQCTEKKTVSLASVRMFFARA